MPTHPHARNRASYLPDNYVPLAEAGVLQLVDEDADDHAGREGPADRRPHDASPDGADRVGRPDRGVRRRSDADDGARAGRVDHGLDLYPMDTLAAKQQFVKEAMEKNTLVFFEHDPAVAAGYIREEDGKRRVRR